MCRMHHLLIFFFFILQGCSSFSTQDPRNIGQHWQDQRIEMDIAGMANSRQFTRTTSINSVSLDGNVLIIGQVTSPQVKTQFIQQAKNINHVEHVYNELEVSPFLGFSDISYDAWLTTKVKSQFIASKQLSGAVIKVISERGKVYLLGYVTPHQGNVAIDIARHVSGVKKVVTLFKQQTS